MRVCWLIGISLVLSAAARPAAADVVRKRDGSSSGKVETVTSTVVTITNRRGASEKIPVNEIIAIDFDAEPNDMKRIRNAVSAERYDEALELLKKHAGARNLIKEVRQDMEFYTALCMARLALDGEGKVSQAGTLMFNFVKNHPTSYHHFEACQTNGDLAMANQLYDVAVAQYDRVASAPWPEYQVRGTVAKGRALQVQKRYEEALAEFDKALQMSTQRGVDALEEARLEAVMGKAVCLAEASRVDEALKLVDNVIRDAPPENGRLYALAYNAKGACLRKDGRTTEALLAYLHVHVIYPAYADAHAEALANLVDLWTESGKPQRANEARQLLKERYADSRWAKGN